MEDEKRELYRRIVQQSNAWAVLARMQDLGFWPAHLPVPPDPPEELAERQQLEHELQELRQQHTDTQDPEKALAAERKRRWDESKKKRAERKAQRAAEAKSRREAFETARQQTIVHVGLDHGAALQHVTSDVARLEALELPILHRAEDLAKAMDISLPRLRWLTYHRRGAAVVHYRRHEIAKKTGGVRNISAPKPDLGYAQRWLYDLILRPLTPSEHAHGFVPGRSILSNAQPHCQQNIVINMDLRHFFPSIGFARVRGLFESIGYSGQLATVMALLCTEPPRVATEFAGKVYSVALGERILPQGACTSPALTNLLCRRLDARLAGVAQRHQFQYTRYADDLTFSTNDEQKIKYIFYWARKILREEGFQEHPSKTKVMRRSRRQEVTGIVVNERLTVPRQEVRLLRAILHNASKSTLAAQNRDQIPHFLSHLRGRIEYVCMVDPKRGQPLKQQFLELVAKEKMK